MNDLSNPKGAIRMYPKKSRLNFAEDKPEVYQLYHLRAGQIDGKEITYYASKAAHVPPSTIELAKAALFDAVTYFCMQGHTVQIPGLGGVGVQFKTKTSATFEEATKDLVKRKYLRFWAKKEVREQCNLKNIHVEIKDILGVLKDDADNGDPSEDGQDNP